MSYVSNEGIGSDSPYAKAF